MRKFHEIFGRLGNSMFQGAYIYAQMRRKEIPDIFIQGESYFEEYKEGVKKLYGDGIIPKSFPWTAIHVRRGDYVDNSFYVDLFKDGYYERAMAEFPDAKFMVFSDDVEWCRRQETFKDCMFSQGNSEVIDMNLMASCSGIIIANSSFSWWAAYLGEHNKVIAPGKWFTDGMQRVELPANWKQI